MKPENIRNIAIIAHVDHGKTTLVDKLLKQGGAFRANQQVEERAMDSMDLEREKGITIRAKNTSVHWKDYIINIVDTPGHADFGGEVERVMKMVDGVLLLCDAYEGTQAQTRFVLKKALAAGLDPIVVINKIDRPNCDPLKVHDQVLELFMELEANDKQFGCPFLYASARNGYAIRDLNDERTDLNPLFETILTHISPPQADPDAPFRMLVSNIDWSDYMGRIGIGKVLSGSTKIGDPIWLLRHDGTRVRSKVTKVFEYSALSTTSDNTVAEAGNIVGLAGFEDVDIGETIAADEKAEPITAVLIDPPTIQMQFAVNDGPLGGREGKLVTSRQIRDRLFREIKTNVSIKVEDSDTAGVFTVSARGSMQIAVLVEQMRREGFEILVSRPTVITQRDEQGNLLEPFENVWIELPANCVGGVMTSMASRRGQMDNMVAHAHSTTLEFTIPTRGLIGFEFDLMNITSGHGVMSHLFKSYEPYAGVIETRPVGTLVSMEGGNSTAYSLVDLLERGILFVDPGEEIYEGMIVGQNSRNEDMPVNPCKEKKLTNMRSQGDGKGIQLPPATKFSLERALEYIAPDEFVEATPKSLRLRKRILNSNERQRAKKSSGGGI